MLKRLAALFVLAASIAHAQSPASAPIPVLATTISGGVTAYVGGGSGTSPASPPRPVLLYCLINTAIANPQPLNNIAPCVFSGGSGGTVTSVGLSLPAIFTVSGSPVTTSGTLAATLATETANYVWAGPTTGTAAAPTFRALVSADIPTTLSSNYTISGSPSSTAAGLLLTGAWLTSGTIMPELYINGGSGTPTFKSTGESIAIQMPASYTGNVLSIYANGGATANTYITAAGTLHTSGQVQANTWATLNNCSSAASPSTCSSYPTGAAVIAASATSVTINTTSFTANSNPWLTLDSSLGTRLGVTCNTGYVLLQVTARVAGTSFTVSAQTAPTTNPWCFDWGFQN